MFLLSSPALVNKWCLLHDQRSLWFGFHRRNTGDERNPAAVHSNSFDNMTHPHWICEVLLHYHHQHFLSPKGWHSDLDFFFFLGMIDRAYFPSTDILRPSQRFLQYLLMQPPLSFSSYKVTVNYRLMMHIMYMHWSMDRRAAALFINSYTQSVASICHATGYMAPIEAACQIHNREKFALLCLSAAHGEQSSVTAH